MLGPLVSISQRNRLSEIWESPAAQAIVLFRVTSSKFTSTQLIQHPQSSGWNISHLFYLVQRYTIPLKQRIIPPDDIWDTHNRKQMEAALPCWLQACRCPAFTTVVSKVCIAQNLPTEYLWNPAQGSPTWHFPERKLRLQTKYKM